MLNGDPNRLKVTQIEKNGVLGGAPSGEWWMEPFTIQWMNYEYITNGISWLKFED